MLELKIHKWYYLTSFIERQRENTKQMKNIFTKMESKIICGKILNNVPHKRWEKEQVTLYKCVSKGYWSTSLRTTQYTASSILQSIHQHFKRNLGKGKVSSTMVYYHVVPKYNCSGILFFLSYYNMVPSTALFLGLIT